ncbi:MAG: RNA polymerase sigma factor [Planctomycetota bacterium]
MKSRLPNLRRRRVLAACLVAALSTSLTALTTTTSTSHAQDADRMTTPEAPGAPATGATFKPEQYTQTAGAVAAFHEVVNELRPDLFRYCRSLTRTPWDAEDVCQETLTRALKRLGETRSAINNLRGYLLRTATNVWIDEVRRNRPELLESPEEAVPADEKAAPEGEQSLAVNEALVELIRRLAPRERICVLLKDVFDLSLEDIAAAAGMSVGGVKAALSRGRTKLREAREAAGAGASVAVARSAAPGESLASQLAAAFNKRDIDGMLGLLHASCDVDLVGFHAGDDRKFAANVVGHTFAEEGLLRAEAVTLHGRDVLLLWYAQATDDGGKREVLGDVWMPAGAAGCCTGMRIYYFCPDLLATIGAQLGVPVQQNPYRY